MTPYPMRLSRADFNAIKAKAASRKEKREEKREALPWAHRVKANMKGLRHATPRKVLKDRIVRLLGLLDRQRNGPQCRIHLNHIGDTSCHIVPQGRGDAARFIPENVYWGCSNANYGEMMNRSHYREIHVRIFGKDYVERIENIARTSRKYTTDELWELHAQIKGMVEN